MHKLFCLRSSVPFSTLAMQLVSSDGALHLALKHPPAVELALRVRENRLREFHSATRTCIEFQTAFEAVCESSLSVPLSERSLCKQRGFRLDHQPNRVSLPQWIRPPGDLCPRTPKKHPPNSVAHAHTTDLSIDACVFARKIFKNL